MRTSTPARPRVDGWAGMKRGNSGAGRAAGIAVAASRARHPSDRAISLTEAAATADGRRREPMSDPVPPAATDAAAPAAGARVVVTLRDASHSFDCAPGETIVQAAVRAGIYPPFSCLQGICATCLARVTEGEVEMIANDVLSPAEVAQGYVLTCQSAPVTREVAVVYEI